MSENQNENQNKDQAKSHQKGKLEPVYQVGMLVMTVLLLLFGDGWYKEWRAHKKDVNDLNTTITQLQQKINENHGIGNSPQINGDGNISTVSSDDHRKQSPTLSNSPISSNGGKVVVGGETDSPDNSHASINGNTGKVLINGNDNSTSINAGTVILQLWTSTPRFNFPSNGSFAFPAHPSSQMESFKELAQTDAFKIALRPFVALGTTQPLASGNYVQMRPDTSSVPRPVSYSKLIDCGALEADTRGQEHLVAVATNPTDKMRPRWTMRGARSDLWIQDDSQRELVQNAQNWINSYHDEMIQVGMLSE